MSPSMAAHNSMLAKDVADLVTRLETELALKVELIEMLKECLDPVGRLARQVCSCDHEGPCGECETFSKLEALLERVS